MKPAPIDHGPLGPALVLPRFRRTEQDARTFALHAHCGQTDKAGHPYARHLTRVLEVLVEFAPRSWRGVDFDEAMQIAWLHDVIEDAPYDGNHLRAEGFSLIVVTGVEWLTRQRGDTRPYAEWIASIGAKAPLHCILVKLADVEVNSDPDRLALLDEATRARLLAKYEPAKVVLRAAAAARGWKGEGA
ncbi:hypothetical protein [Methylobacterium sp. CCH5-D2]|uniref:hypothetical protein n=1 Tax=Methylobacterium sp. CCH5-D2 TaxID=1768765 RepID=UPI000834AAD5|nr:hypothetical protein [Methylobacterium sp. CCH5-D2]